MPMTLNLRGISYIFKKSISYTNEDRVDSDSLWVKYGFESSSYAHYMFYVSTAFAILILPFLVIWLALLPCL